MAVAPPALARMDPLEGICSSQLRATRGLVYCPDAFGYHALAKLPHLHERLRQSSTHEVELASVLPPKTPVCFASLFTGGSPEEHGIRRYERPVLTCDTIFDALVRAGKRVAIVAVHDSSIDLIFRERALDYFSVAYDPLATAQALDLLKRDEHDVIVVYHQEYDDLLHATGPFSELSVQALEHHVASWEALARAASRAWKQNFVVAFTPDHGGHVCLDGYTGDHGDDCPEDMSLRHFFLLG